MYGGDSRIEKFDVDAQGQIHNSFDELHALLGRIFKLLRRVADSNEKHQTKASTVSKLSQSVDTTHLATPLTSPEDGQKVPEPSLPRKKSALALLKWIFRDKKDIADIIGRFSEVNDRLMEMVRFWSLVSDIGIDLRHLQYLRNDEDATNLGFHADVSLALVVSDVNYVPSSFELDRTWNVVSKDSKKIFDRFATFQWNDQYVLHESCVRFP